MHQVLTILQVISYLLVILKLILFICLFIWHLIRSLWFLDCMRKDFHLRMCQILSLRICLKGLIFVCISKSFRKLYLMISFGLLNGSQAFIYLLFPFSMFSMSQIMYLLLEFLDCQHLLWLLCNILKSKYINVKMMDN